MVIASRSCRISAQIFDRTATTVWALMLTAFGRLFRVLPKYEHLCTVETKGGNDETLVEIKQKTAFSRLKKK